jgi:hypothetical protein
VYWSRLFIAIATGVGSVAALRGVVGEELATLVYATIAVLVYGTTAAVYRNLLGYGEAQLKGKNKYITLGIGTFIFAWLAALILTYTMLGIH